MKTIVSDINNDDEYLVDRSRGAKQEAESIHEDLESTEDGQLFGNQPVKSRFFYIWLLNAAAPSKSSFGELLRCLRQRSFIQTP